MKPSGWALQQTSAGQATGRRRPSVLAFQFAGLSYPEIPPERSSLRAVASAVLSRVGSAISWSRRLRVNAGSSHSGRGLEAGRAASSWGVLQSVVMGRVDAILAQALELSDDERARLALRLAESLQPPPAASAPAAWAAEVARRIERLRDGSAKTVSEAKTVSATRAAVANRRT